MISISDIRELRHSMGLTQQAFGSLLGLSFVTVSRWENGHSNPRGLGIVILELLSSALAQNAPHKIVNRLRSVDSGPTAIIRELMDLAGD